MTYKSSVSTKYLGRFLDPPISEHSKGNHPTEPTEPPCEGETAPNSKIIPPLVAYETYETADPWRRRSAALQAEFARATGEPLTADEVGECDQIAREEMGTFSGNSGNSSPEPSPQALKFVVCFLMDNPAARDDLIAKAEGFGISSNDIEAAAVKYSVERSTRDGTEIWRMP